MKGARGDGGIEKDAAPFFPHDRLCAVMKG